LNYSFSSSNILTTSSKPFDGFLTAGFLAACFSAHSGAGTESFILNQIFLFFVSNNINLALTISPSFTTSFGFCTDF
jgi:hypothetical protein